MEEKPNEITAIPDILSDIDISDAVISIDAMGTQREIVELIIRSGGHYLLAVKDNTQVQYPVCKGLPNVEGDTQIMEESFYHHKDRIRT